MAQVNVVELLLFFALIIHQTLCVNPHIIFILADDLGWNDVGFHGSNQIPTPNIDALAYTGIILNNYYVTPICTPSRSALMTGKYPIHTGLQSGVIHGSTPYGLELNETIFPQFLKTAGYTTEMVGKWHLGSFKKEYTPQYRGLVYFFLGMQHKVLYGGEPWGLGLDEKMLPQFLKKANYTTSMVGKWHLGHFKKEYLPENRGFDSHYGYWTGHQDYYDHTALEKCNYFGYDMRRGMNVSWNDIKKYTTDLFTNEAVKIIKNHDLKKPLFLYMAHLATHSANPIDPLQAPPDVVARFSYIKNKERRLFAGMLAKLDESVGLVVSALAEKDMLNNSIIIFSTDNGGPAAGFNLNAASNWPLRGVKDTLWEGGVRGAAFIWSPLLPSSKVSNALIHITDWLPTLISLTTAPDLPPNLDGINIWQSLLKEETPTRKEILLNIDDKRHVSAIRYKNWKYKKGNTGSWNQWYGPSGRNMPYKWTKLYNGIAAKAMQHIRQLPSKESIKQIRHAATVICDSHEEADTIKSKIYLYDLDSDPCEKKNLASIRKDIVQVMEEKLKIYESTKIPPRNKPMDWRSNPIYWNFTWTNWMDYVEEQ